MCLAVPGQVKQVYLKDELPMAKVDFGGILKEVCMAYLPDTKAGEYVIVHVGFAINVLDEKSALETLDLFKEIGRLEEELEPKV